jgi:hypothetical protein
MKNIFKNSSRFSILNEDTESNENKTKQPSENKTKQPSENKTKQPSENKTKHFIKENKIANNNSQSNSSYLRNNSDANFSRDKRNRFNYDPEKEKQKLKVLKEEKIKKDLDINSFPEMKSITTKKIINNQYKQKCN